MFRALILLFLVPSLALAGADCDLWRHLAPLEAVPKASGVFLADAGSSEALSSATVPDRKYSAYQGIKSALFLADGGENGNWMPLAPKVAEKFPGMKVVRGDLHIAKTTETDNLTSMPLDNTKPFPFKNDSFQRIVMKRGLCNCRRDGNLCGGIEFKPEAISRFLIESARVLDKNDPTSEAIFLNDQTGWLQSRNVWRKAAALVVKAEPRIEVQLLFDLDGRFDGVRMVPKAK